VKIDQPKTFERRDEVAGKCTADLKLTMPVLVDDMQNTLSTAYNAMPDRLFIVGADAKIAYRGDRGPRGFDADAMAAALKKILAASSQKAAPKKDAGEK
jgi:hypothetical protein